MKPTRVVKPEENKGSAPRGARKAPPPGAAGGARKPPGTPLFLRGSEAHDGHEQSGSHGAGQPLASTTDGVTTFHPSARAHPAAAEIEAHEAVHRSQFAAGAPRGTRSELERDANTGARELLGGRAYAPAYSAAPRETLNYDPAAPPLMPDPTASATANATSLSLLGAGSDKAANINVTTSAESKPGASKNIQYHIDVTGSGHRGSVNTTTDISVSYSEKTPWGLAPVGPDPQAQPGLQDEPLTDIYIEGKPIMGPAVPVALYPVQVRYNRELELKDADGRNVVVNVSANIYFTHETWERETSGRPLTFETLLDLHGDSADFLVALDGSGPLQNYFAYTYIEGGSLNVQSAAAEGALALSSELLPDAAPAPARFVRAEVTAGEQFDSLEAFLNLADAIELARRLEEERQRREAHWAFGLFGDDSSSFFDDALDWLSGKLSWLSDIVESAWDSLPAPVRGVLKAVGKFVAVAAAVVAVAALIVFLSPVEIGIGATMLVIGAFALGFSLGSSLYSRYKEAVGAGSVDPGAILSAAVLDAVGLGGFIESLTDESLLTGRDLNRTEEERWEGGTSGLLQFGGLVFGVRGMRGLRGGQQGGGGAGVGRGGPRLLEAGEGETTSIIPREPTTEPLLPVEPVRPTEPVITVEPTAPTTGGAPLVRTYGQLKGRLPQGEQANHLNQDAAFRDVIPHSEGAAVSLRGNAFTEVGSPHYEFHRSLEGFWNQFRPGGARAGETPTCGEYGTAVNRAMRAAGASESEAAAAVEAARANREQFGLMETDPVPRIPGRMSQRRP